MGFRLDGVGLTHANGFTALADVSLAAARGERIAVIGPSGAGKTTLLRLLGAALRPTDGVLSLLDADPWALPAGELRGLRARIGVVHQAPPLPQRQRVVTAVLAGRLGQWPLWRSVASLVYPLDIAGARAALTRLDLGDRLFERCDRISGGQLQRVGIARVLYQQPNLVLADEPVSALDPALARQAVRVLVQDATARSATLVASLHAVDLALAEFPRVVGVRDGRIAFDLPTTEVSETRLRELYASEGAELPTLANEARFAAHAVDTPPPVTGARCR